MSARLCMTTWNFPKLEDIKKPAESFSTLMILLKVWIEQIKDSTNLKRKNAKQKEINIIPPPPQDSDFPPSSWQV